MNEMVEGQNGCEVANLAEGLVRCSVVDSRGHHTRTPCLRVPITLFDKNQLQCFGGRRFAVHDLG